MARKENLANVESTHIEIENGDVKPSKPVMDEIQLKANAVLRQMLPYPVVVETAEGATVEIKVSLDRKRGNFFTRTVREEDGKQVFGQRTYLDSELPTEFIQGGGKLIRHALLLVNRDGTRAKLEQNVNDLTAALDTATKELELFENQNAAAVQAIDDVEISAAAKVTVTALKTENATLQAKTAALTEQIVKMQELLLAAGISYARS